MTSLYQIMSASAVALMLRPMLIDALDKITSAMHGAASVIP